MSESWGLRVPRSMSEPLHGGSGRAFRPAGWAFRPMSAAGTAHPGFPPQSPIAELSALLALIIVANLPWSYGMIGDAGGRLALVLVDFAALAGGLGFPLLGRLHWAWLNSWW